AVSREISASTPFIRASQNAPLNLADRLSTRSLLNTYLKPGV
ncbi:unnamed protein product, partial [Oikopleura dioica]